MASSQPSASSPKLQALSSQSRERSISSAMEQHAQHLYQQYLQKKLKNSSSSESSKPKSIETLSSSSSSNMSMSMSPSSSEALLQPPPLSSFMSDLEEHPLSGSGIGTGAEILQFEPSPPKPLHGPFASHFSSHFTALARPLAEFLRTTRIHEQMPLHSKIIVVDLDLHVKEAFLVAVENNISFACVWDSQTQKYCGMFTVSDFTDILVHFHDKENVIAELENHRVRAWRQLRPKPPSPLISISPEATLMEATKLLQTHRIHRLPVIDEGGSSLLSIITHSPLLQYMVSRIGLGLDIFSYSLHDLKIGSYSKIETCHYKSPLIDVLRSLSSLNITAIPIVDDDGVVQDIYSKFDAMYIALERIRNLETTSVSEALRLRPRITLVTCQKTDSLGSVVAKLVQYRVHRLIIVDDARRVRGIVSTSDVLSFVIRHSEEDARD